MKKFLRAVLSLISLNIAVDAGMSKSVEVRKTSPPLLPALRILHISAAFNPEYCAFISLLQTRRHSEIYPGLVSVQFALNSPVNDDGDWSPERVKVEFDKLIGERLRLRVIYHDVGWRDGTIGESETPSFQLAESEFFASI
jgi:hypothetical protein